MICIYLAYEKNILYQTMIYNNIKIYLIFRVKKVLVHWVQVESREKYFYGINIWCNL